MAAQQFYLALDLKNDEALIREYKEYHRQIWPEIADSIRAAGITRLDLFCTGNRLFMVLEADADFSFEKKAAMDDANPKVQEWENLMWKFQQPLPWSKPGQKWVLMDKIFELPG